MKFLRFFALLTLISTVFGFANAQSVTTSDFSVAISDSTDTADSSFVFVPRHARPSKFSYGFTAGIGYGFNTGTLKNNFSNAMLFNLGVFGGYRQLRLKVNATYAQPSFRNANIFNETTTITTTDGPLIVPSLANNSSHATQFAVSLQAGFTVYESRSFAVTPNVGYNFKSCSWNLDVLNWKQNDSHEWIAEVTDVQKASLRAHSFIASIDFDIKLRRKFTHVPLLGDSGFEQYTHAIRISPFASHERYNKCDPATSGWAFGITLGYCGIARALSL